MPREAMADVAVVLPVAAGLGAAVRQLLRRVNSIRARRWSR